MNAFKAGSTKPHSRRFSVRETPAKTPLPVYPDRFEPRYVSANGGIRLNRDCVSVSIVCAGEYVSLKEIDDGV